MCPNPREVMNVSPPLGLARLCLIEASDHLIEASDHFIETSDRLMEASDHFIETALAGSFQKRIFTSGLG